MTKMILGLFLLGAVLSSHTTAAVLQYFGARIGRLSELNHGVSGEVFAVDSRTLFIKNFNYDGIGPAAYFYVGTSSQPSNPPNAWRVRDERGNPGVLRGYRNKDITLSLPEGKTLRDIKWFSVWCEDYAVNFGSVDIPRDLDFPRPQKIAGLKGIHAVTSDPIVIVDAQTLLIPNFSYDGEAPDAKFWTGRGQKPSPQGIRIPDENGRIVPLRRYDRKTIVLTLPGDVTVFDIGHFGVWCEAFAVDFAHVKIPESANVPPSLKMLGISPQSKLNCEVLLDDIAFEVRWAVAGESVVIQLVAKLDDGDYMSFGISPDVDKSVMIGSDVAVAWIDKATGKGYANDYYLEAKSQCSGNHGSCPDPVFEKNTNSIRLLNAAMVNGFSIVTYQRPLRASDRFDLPVHTNRTQAIVWALGPLNDKSETSYHNKVLRSNRLINFGREPSWNCPVPDEKKDFERDSAYEEDRPQSDKLTQTADRRGSNQYFSEVKPVHEEKPQSVPAPPPPQRQRNPPQRQQPAATPVQPEVQGQFEVVERAPRPTKARPPATPRPAAKDGAWEIPPIQCYEPEDGVFYAQMGPTGGKHGYSAITGHVGWGISIYINGLLIPEINVVRGKTYTFVVETGNDPEVPSKYHPFYITDDPVGGFEHKTDEERAQVRVFAGITRLRNGEVAPSGTGRLCNWEPDLDGPPADAYPSFGAYQRSLTLKCEQGEPGIVTWTPDENTPDTVYYQCYSHRYLGWRINVVDECDAAALAASDQVESYYDRYDNVEAAPSIRHETKVQPNGNFIKNNYEKEVFKNHNMNGIPPSQVTLDLHKNSEISKIIADGIRAAEALEESVTKNSSHLLNNQEIFPRYPSNDFRQQIYTGPGNLQMYLRPPQGMRPHRRPIMEKRPPPPPMMRDRPQRPPLGFSLPQPSMLVNHYKSPMQTIQGPFRKMIKPRPMPPGVLLLGETSELHMMNNKKPTDPYTKPNQAMQKQNGQKQGQAPEIMSKIPKPIDLPYNLNTKEALQQKPILVPKAERLRQDKPLAKISAYKPPFDMRKDRFSVRPMLGLHDGFKPESLVVETGFKPIVRRREDAEGRSDDREALFERQMDSRERELEIDEAIEKEGVFIKTQEQTEQFEPMFKPSPLDSITVEENKRLAAAQRREDKLTGDLEEMNVEDGDDKMAMAAENYETLYLPPPAPAFSDFPEGSVVTYDGKAVLDASLVSGKPPQVKEARKHTGTGSRLEQLIRDKPQFGPFRGEIPPLPEFISYDTSPVINPIVKHGAGQSPLNPIQVPSHEDAVVNKPISTKLTIVKANDGGEELKRERRAAHHHPDHHGDEHDSHDHHMHAASSSDLLNRSNLLLTVAFSMMARFWMR